MVKWNARGRGTRGAGGAHLGLLGPLGLLALLALLALLTLLALLGLVLALLTFINLSAASTWSMERMGGTRGGGVCSPRSPDTSGPRPKSWS